MRHRAVPVSLGSARFRTFEVDGIAVVEAWFPPGLVLEPHVHERACFAVMLEGSFDVTFPGVRHASTPTTLHTEPAGEKHANYIGSAGAHVMVLQPDSRREDLFQPTLHLLNRVTCLEHVGVADLAARISRELHAPDDITPLSVESLSLEMLALGARAERSRKRSGTPDWLLRTEDQLRDRWREPVRIADLANEVGVHPALLARAFRRRHGIGIAAYLRRLRLEWASGQLRQSTASLAAIAASAGFADQSHFTRAFRRQTGMTPAGYRQAVARP
jgi:AraC family transcriptional regulator